MHVCIKCKDGNLVEGLTVQMKEYGVPRESPYAAFPMTMSPAPPHLACTHVHRMLGLMMQVNGDVCVQKAYKTKPLGTYA